MGSEKSGPDPEEAHCQSIAFGGEQSAAALKMTTPADHTVTHLCYSIVPADLLHSCCPLQIRWYSFQFLMQQLADELNDSFIAMANVLAALPQNMQVGLASLERII